MSRHVLYIPANGYVKERGYRVSIVEEGKPGHCPTGVWPNDGTETMPWFYGHDYEKAVAAADQQNERMGISKEEAARIVQESMNLGPVNPAPMTSERLAQWIQDQVICEEFGGGVESIGNDDVEANENIMGEEISHSFDLIIQQPDGSQPVFRITVEELDR